LVKEKSDIFTLLNVLEDLNELKLVIFNKFQAMCFNFIRKPSLISNDEYSDLFRSIKSAPRDQLIHIIGYFSNLIKKGSITNLDNKFFTFLEEEIKGVILNLNNLENT